MNIYRVDVHTDQESDDFGYFKYLSQTSLLQTTAAWKEFINNFD